MTSFVKYTGLSLLKKCCSAAVLVTCCTGSIAQSSDSTTESSNKKNVLSFYHSITPAKVKHTYQRLDYTRPNNQLMSWPGYNLTAAERDRQYITEERENKIGNVIAKDIITGLLKKKTKVAVIPKF